MDALVMCGGEGTRLDAATEKPLHELRGRHLVDYVLDALAAGPVDDVYAVTSPATPRTREYVEDRVRVVDAPGDGYVEDLQYALDRVSTPVLTVAADAPLLDAESVEFVRDARDDGSLTVCTPAVLCDALGASADAAFTHAGREVVPSGVNVVADGPDEVVVTWDARFAVNVNYPSDAALAERLLSGRPE